MKVFPSNTTLKLEDVFRVAYHDDFTSSIRALPMQQLSRAEIDIKEEEILQCSSLNLAGMFDQVRLSGESLSFSESGTVKDFIGECQTDVELLKGKISNAISAIGQLCRDISDASRLLAIRQSQIQLGQYLVSPRDKIQSLPQDILEQIFLACYRSTASFRPSPIRPPLQLAAVCYRWREICLSMPILWQFVTYSSMDSRTLDLAPQFLNRCRFPIVSIHNRSGHSTLEGFLERLKDPDIRLRGLEVDFVPKGTVEDEPQVLTEVQGCNLDQLEEVVIRDSGQRVDIMVPNLKRFSCQKIPKSWTISPPPAQLTNLLITDALSWKLCEFILAHCPHLRTLMISVADTGIEGTHPEADLSQTTSQAIASARRVLPELTSLGLANDFFAGEVPPGFLDSFTFPRLKAFEYYVEYQGQESLGWVTSRDFLPQICHLTLHLSNPRPEIVMPIVTLATSLEELCLACPEAGFDDILQVFATIPSLDPPSNTLHNLKIFKFVSSLPFDNLKVSAPKFRQLAEAWSKSPVEKKSTHHCTCLKIYSWTKLSSGAASLREMIVGDGLGLSLELVRFTPEYFVPGTPMGFTTHRIPFTASIVEWDLPKDGVEFTRRFSDVLS
ncbi:hypothetical protein BDN72DRAFT_845206 [Pluteus cervinus]|uniref:Uncharacterized protein n=1 Tax=Pluteus cervinus TaxID=181527 RepID=A0ACD3AJ22_9AGAR|nr:hypothetical protein BDN72DRAFT_845206 [Pluteus cervinus]